MLQLLSHSLVLGPFVLLLIQQEKIVLVGWSREVVLGMERVVVVLLGLLGLGSRVGGGFSFVDGFVLVPASSFAFVHC